jgi:hypothetical protein
MKAEHRVFVWEDPREPEIPRWVGYGTGLAPWTALWDFRSHGTGTLFDWLRELDASGLQPKVCKFWAVGQVMGCQIDYIAARTIARVLIMLIARASHGDGPSYPPHPPFLLNPRLGKPDDRKPVIAEGSDGKTFCFSSVGHAVEHGFTRSAIYRALAGGTHRGLRWRYATGTKPGRQSRPVERLAADDQVTAFSSLSAASRAVGFSRPTIARLIETGQLDRDHCRWRVGGHLLDEN